MDNSALLSSNMCAAVAMQGFLLSAYARKQGRQQDMDQLKLPLEGSSLRLLVSLR